MQKIILSIFSEIINNFERKENNRIVIQPDSNIEIIK